MRIETWDLKYGDPISVYIRSGGEYIGETIIDVWEQHSELYVNFKGRLITKDRVSSKQHKGVAVFDDETSKWFLVGNTYI